MQSQMLLRSVVIVTALAFTGASASAAGPGAAPTGESLLPAPASGADQDSFWSQWEQREPGIRWKGISVMPSFEYRAFYTDNLFTFQQFTAKQDFVHYVSPQLALTREFHLGDWDLALGAGYTPTFIVHSFNGEFDRTYHLARVGITATREEQIFNLDHTYNRSSEITSELGFLVPQVRHQTQLAYRQPLSGKLSFQTSAAQQFTDTSVTTATTARSFKSWSGDAFVLYDWLPKTTTGLGLGASYQEQDGSQGAYQSMFEQVLSRWHYFATGKINLSLDVGIQFGQSLNQGGQDFSPTPIAQAQVHYAPRYGTTFTLSAARTSRLSQLQSGLQFTENSVTFGVRQRVYQSMSAGITAAYGHGTFEDIQTVVAVSRRNYDYYTIGVQYTWQASARWRLTGFYQYLRRQSDLVSDTYSNNQVGFVVNLAL